MEKITFEKATIDPAVENPRAKHVYEKAGFEHIDDFLMQGDCSGSGKKHHLLIKKFKPTVVLEEATRNDSSIIQEMAKFYREALSKACGYFSDKKRLRADRLSNYAFENYFTDDTRKVYLIKVYKNIAGFILLNQVTTDEESDWNVGEFFILGKYQNNGIGKQAAEKVWMLYPGQWEVSVIPENRVALAFWENTIKHFTGGHYTQETKLIGFDKTQPKREVFTFNRNNVIKTVT